MADSEEMNELFWSGFCTLLPIWAVLFGVNIFAALMLGFSFPFLEPGSRTYVVAVLDVGALLIAFLGIVMAVRKCGQRQKNQYGR